MKKLFIFASIFSALSAQASPSVANEINAEITKRLLTVMSSNGCSERIWPGYSWENLTVVFIGDEVHQAFSAKEKRVFSVSSDQLPSAAIKTAYFFFKQKDGSEWMSINTALDLSTGPKRNPEEVAKDNFRLAIHEGFHWVAQKNWHIYEGNRGTELPIRWEPRLYRSIMFSQLKAALAEKNQTETQLRKARYWYDRWSSEYPDEVISTADGYEGSARYSDWTGYALSELGCDASEAQLSVFVQSILDSNYGFAMNGDLFAFDVEGYELGSLAAFLLRRDYVNDDWQEKLSEGQSPVAILLEKFSPVFSEPDLAMQQKFKDSGKKFQEEADKLVGHATALLAAHGTVFVSIPRSWYLGSFSPLGFFIDRATNIQLVPMGMPLTFTSPSGTSAMRSELNAVFLSNPQAPCGSPSDWQFAVSGTKIHFSETGQARLEDSFFSGNLSGVTAQSATGAQWFCAGE
ncbi:MAG: hypothetical protein AB7K68_10875 [Bacteriovoracia bacterium]